MRIYHYRARWGNDFSATLECEHCGAQQELSTGYHDDYYHDVVIPGICCQSCGKNRSGRKTGRTENDHISEDDALVAPEFL